MVKFGPAGTPDKFVEVGYKKTIQIADYLKEINLDTFEYQCGNGVTIKEKAATELGNAFKDKGLTISLHAPYYISLSSVEKEKRDKSIDYILQSARAASFMGAERIVIHSGSTAKISREQAMEYSSDTLLRAFEAIKNENLDHIHICPELMGKINQLGTLTEVLELCLLNDTFIPVIDFGHLNARTYGSIKTSLDYENIFNEIEDKLGYDRLRTMHCHFSKIEYTLGGEKKHLTFEDREFGPDFEPLAELLYKKDSDAYFICESAGSQDIDALEMKNKYLRYFL